MGLVNKEIIFKINNRTILFIMRLSYFKQQIRIEERKIQDGFNQSNK